MKLSTALKHTFYYCVMNIIIVLIEVHGNLILKDVVLTYPKTSCVTSGIKTKQIAQRSRTLPRHVVGFRLAALLPGFTMLQGVVEEASRTRELLKVSAGKMTLNKGWIIILLLDWIMVLDGAVCCFFRILVSWLILSFFPGTVPDDFSRGEN